MASHAKRSRPIVVKIGGSLAAGPNLKAWLETLDFACDPIIIVPGGGAFADAIRSAQKAIGFDDAAAHHMALLAMEQYGIALASLAPRLTNAATPAAIQRAWRMGSIPFWAPAQMALDGSVLPNSWEITSDSLAAWLAPRIGATRLLLIKSVDADSDHEVTATDLVAAGLVDPLFPRFAATSGAETYIAGPAALPDAAVLLTKGEMPGVHVRFG